MFTKSGILILSKKERKSLEYLKKYVAEDIKLFDIGRKEVSELTLSTEVIDFILQITFFGKSR